LTPPSGGTPLVIDVIYTPLFYCTVIRRIAEYASPVWHSSLTAAQSDVLESLQKRAMNIIFPGDDYTFQSFNSVTHLNVQPGRS